MKIDLLEDFVLYDSVVFSFHVGIFQSVFCDGWDRNCLVPQSHHADHLRNLCLPPSRCWAQGRLLI